MSHCKQPPTLQENETYRYCSLLLTRQNCKSMAHNHSSPEQWESSWLTHQTTSCTDTLIPPSTIWTVNIGSACQIKRGYWNWWSDEMTLVDISRQKGMEQGMAWLGTENQVQHSPAHCHNQVQHVQASCHGWSLGRSTPTHSMHCTLVYISCREC